jgi:hypothetical protein
VIYQYQCIATTTSQAYKNTNINRATSLITLFNSNHAISLWLQSIATCNSELIYINVSTVNRNVYIQLILFSSVHISAYGQHASSVLSISIMKVSVCFCYSIPQQHIIASNINVTFIIVYLLIYLQIYSAVKSATCQPSSSCCYSTN